MPKLNGLDIIESLREKWGNDIPEVVLINGYHEHTLKSFELGVIDSS